MPKKNCCCGSVIPPDGNCLVIKPECIGRTYRFTADFLLRFLCIPFNSAGSFDIVSTYTACGGQVFQMKQNLEHWRVTWEHTITSEDVSRYYTAYGKKTEFNLQLISPGPSYLTVDIASICDPNRPYCYKKSPDLRYSCDEYYIVDIGLFIGYKETLPCGEIWEIPFIYDEKYGGLFNCGNAAYFRWARGLPTTNESCIAKSSLTGTPITSGGCAGYRWSQYLTNCFYLETTDHYIPSTTWSVSGSMCGNNCQDIDPTIYNFNQKYFYAYRTLLVEEV